MFKKAGIIYISLITGLFSCKVDPQINKILPADNLVEVIPQGWPQPVYTFSNNAIDTSKFILGRSLFYETLLSQDNTISCSSCHQNGFAFANNDHRVSHGINEINGKRNSPALFNLNWYPYFMHDGGINHIEVQPLGPITNPIEMAETIQNVVAKLNASAKYRKLFKNAYGTEEVTDQRMLKAMAQFMGLMYSYNSKYDRYKRHENNTQLSASELNGYSLFLANCNTCHKEPLFTDFQFRNNGYRIDPLVKDSGRAHITKLAEDLYKFKTPSLRNITITYPYMHDGQFATLEQCLDHYTNFTAPNGIVNMTNLDPLLANGIPLSTQEKNDIIAFLNTLTDYEFISDLRFADPNYKHY